MRLRSALPLVLGAALMSTLAHAKRPNEYQEPRQMTAEEIAAAKAATKGNLHGFDERMEEKPKEIPWTAISLALLAILVAAPFALRAYRSTARELTGANSSLGPGPGRRPLD